MSNARRAIPLEIVAGLGKFVNCPRTFCRIRRSCTAVYAISGSECPVTLEVFEEAVCSLAFEDREAAGQWLRIANVESLREAETVLIRSLSRGRMFFHLKYLVADASESAISRLQPPTLEVLLSMALCGQLPAELTSRIAEAMKLRELRPRFSFPSVSCAQAVAAVLDAFKPAPGSLIEAIIVGSAKAGYAECFDLALDRTDYPLASIDCMGIMAARGGSVTIMERVLASGVLMRDDGWELLAAVEGGSLEMCRYLVSSGVRTDGVAGKWTPWNAKLGSRYSELGAFYALLSRPEKLADGELAAFLVDIGLDPNQRFEKWPSGIISFAVLRGRPDMVPTLVSLGANVSIADVIYSESLISEYRWDAEMVLWLVAQGHDVNAPIPGEPYGFAVTAAAGRGNLEALKLLVSLGAELDVCGGEYSLTPLGAALMGGQIEGYRMPKYALPIVKFLLTECPQLATRNMGCGTAPMGVLETFVQNRRARNRMRSVLLAHGATKEKIFGGDWLVRCKSGLYCHAYKGRLVRDLKDARLVKRWVRKGLRLDFDS